MTPCGQDLGELQPHVKLHLNTHLRICICKLDSLKAFVSLLQIPSVCNLPICRPLTSICCTLSSIPSPSRTRRQGVSEIHHPNQNRFGRDEGASVQGAGGLSSDVCAPAGGGPRTTRHAGGHRLDSKLPTRGTKNQPYRTCDGNSVLDGDDVHFLLKLAEVGLHVVIPPSSSSG